MFSDFGRYDDQALHSILIDINRHVNVWEAKKSKATDLPLLIGAFPWFQCDFFVIHFIHLIAMFCGNINSYWTVFYALCSRLRLKFQKEWSIFISKRFHHDESGKFLNDEQYYASNILYNPSIRLLTLCNVTPSVWVNLFGFFFKILLFVTESLIWKYYSTHSMKFIGQ